MGYYEDIRKEINIDQNIVGGVLHSNGIYLFGENFYDKKIHGKEYDDWDYPRVMSITGYVPTLREKGNEWFQWFVDDATRLVAISNVKGIDFLGVCNKNFVIGQQNIVSGYDGFTLFGRVIATKGAITDMAVIDDVVYASASGGEVYKRIKNTKWANISTKEVQKHFSDNNFTNGFLCIDGFSDNEIYAGGNKGTLWIYENNEWKPIGLSLDCNIKQIICASDNFVYLNCERYILKGRKDEWQKITIPKKLHWEHSIKKIEWFKGELYVLPMFASAYGMAVYRDDKLQEVKVGSFSINPEKIINDNLLLGVETKNMDTNVFIPGGINDMVANDELLMITGNDEVILFNGERWFYLFDKTRSEEELREKGTFYDPREK
ncbi:hypothetical protein QJU96_09905 [Pasteurella skyensis]|uniref:hypothetical protein n=1 Tax=Phocoenobacter skyensis TaxID=97481 RepID=UPI00278ED947|nr:hypothetical protein [Pasteurella skyensis]MDP8171595.1 hypothetical protein [Pasteurella skyensis]